MTSDQHQRSERDSHLEQVLAEYLRSVEAGEAVDQQSIILAHPDLADELASFFRDRSAISAFANAAIDATVDSGHSLDVNN